MPGDRDLRHGPIARAGHRAQLFDRELMFFEERLALAETLSHIEYLRVRGRLHREMVDGTWLYEAPRGSAWSSVTVRRSIRRHGRVSSTADIYERGRPAYPAETVAAIGHRRPARRSLDLGCGTGKYTRLLSRRRRGRHRSRASSGDAADASRSVAGRPASCPARRKRSRSPDGSVDVVTCASAFHWFDHARALPGDRTRPSTGRPPRHRVEPPRQDRRLVRRVLEHHRTPPRTTHPATAPAPGAWHSSVSALRSHRRALVRPRADAPTSTASLARVASISFIETLPPDQRSAVIAESESFIQTHPDTKDLSVFEIPYRSVAYVTAAT